MYLRICEVFLSGMVCLTIDLSVGVPVFFDKTGLKRKGSISIINVRKHLICRGIQPVLIKVKKKNTAETIPWK